MAAVVATYSEDHLVLGRRKPDIQRQKTGLVDVGLIDNGLRSTISALAGFWEKVQRRKHAEAIVPFTFGATNGPRQPYEPDAGKARDLRVPLFGLSGSVIPPPPYNDSIADSPPDYTATDALATLLVYHDGRPELESSKGLLDVSALDGIRSYANKKAKKAAKAAQTAKWADSGDEGEKKDGEDGGDPPADGNGDSGAGGDGGDPPGGGDEPPGDDDWFGGGGSKKKDKKKVRNSK